MDLLAVILGVIGGLAVFLYGLHLLSDSLKKAVGERLKQLLAKVTGNPVKGAFFGALSAATVHSGMTMVILMGLINAGVLTLTQGIGIMLGSEIGTTITAQLVASDIGIVFYPVIALGFLTSILAKSEKYKNVGHVVLSLGLLYLGMNLMTSSIRPLQDEPQLESFLYGLGQFPLSGLLAGIVITGIFNSSTALMGLVLSLGMNNMITLEAGIAILLGANIGSCVTGLMASFGSSLSAKRLSLTQVLVNVIGVLLFFPFITNFAGFISITSTTLARQIANAHTVFNIIVTLIMLPMVGILATLVTKLMPGEEIKIRRGTEFVNDKLLAAPSIALAQAEKEIFRMGSLTSEMLDKAISAIQNSQKESIAKVKELEGIVDEIYHTVDKFLNDSRFVNLNDSEFKKLAYLKHSLNDIERVGDHANNLAELAERKMKKNLQFSEDAKKELTTMCTKAKTIYEKALSALEGGDEEVVKAVREIEEEIDRLQRVFEANHIRRLENNICNPLGGIVFVDILRNLERVGDHSTNIANAVLLGF